MSAQILSNPHLKPQLICTTVSLDGQSKKTVPEQIPITNEIIKAELPKELIFAIGQDTIDSCRSIMVKETGTGYLDGCINLDSFLEGESCIKGHDQYGRSFFSFLIKCCDKLHVFTMLKRYDDESELFVHRNLYDCSTDDTSFLSGSTMYLEKYEIISSIFEGTHSDMSLGKK